MPDGQQVVGVSFFLPGGYDEAASNWVVHPTWQQLCPQEGSGPPSSDLAVLTLAVEVPETVLEAPAKVFLGPAALSDQLDDGHGFIAGFGGTVSYDSGDGSGSRRHGWLGPPVHLEKDPCEWYDKNHCNDAWEWEMEIRFGAYGAPGDSGGPLIKRIYASDWDTVVGVLHGSYEYDADGKPYPTAVWAATGSGTGASPDNATFLLQALGGDPDGDGVPESLDNCPASYCTDHNVAVEHCANILQLDIDDDGWGDEYCDNCSPNDCIAAGLYLSDDCYNPSQANGDGDKWGDRCDLCPWDQVAQTDTDGDHVGDACDNCPGTANPYPACSAEGACPLPRTGYCIIETLPDGVLTDGRCAGQIDGDDDGLGDGCDTCPNIPTPLGEDNSNDIAEETAAAPTLGDVCDRVPIAKLDPQEVPEYPKGMLFVQGDGKDPDDVVAINGSTWLGRVSASTPGTPGTIDESITLSQCDCYSPQGVRIADLKECVKALGVCTSLNPLSDFAWKGITLERPSTPPVAIPPGQPT